MIPFSYYPISQKLKMEAEKKIEELTQLVLKLTTDIDALTQRLCKLESDYSNHGHYDSANNWSSRLVDSGGRNHIVRC
jgi:hypothetical protein